MRELKNNEYLNAMKPIIYMMKIICAMPFRIKPQNNVPNIVSSKMVSSIALVTCIMYHIYYGNEAISIISNGNNLNMVILVVKGPEVVFECFALTVPLIMWNRNKQIQEYWDSWNIFQMKYENITETPYASRKRKCVKTATKFCICWLITRTLYAAFVHTEIYNSIADFVADCYNHILIHVLLTYWFVNCAYFWSTSEDILISAKKILIEKKETRKLNRLISLWLNLSDLTNDFNEAHSFLFLSVFTMIVTVIVTYSYALLNYSTYKIVYPFAYFSNVLLIYLSFLVILCETSHSVYHQINYLQKEALLGEDAKKLELQVLQSVVRFLQTICSQNSAMNFNGFFTLTRMEFAAIASLCINYLIVLRQFQTT